MSLGMLLHRTPLSLNFIALFSQFTFCSWLQISWLHFWASFCLILILQIDSSGLTIGGFVLSKSLTSNPSLANTAIFIMAVHLNHFKGGSTDAFCRNGWILSAFLYPADCAMSYRYVLAVLESERIGQVTEYLLKFKQVTERNDIFLEKITN